MDLTDKRLDLEPATLKSNSLNGLLDFRDDGQRSVKSRHQANFAERDDACSRAAVRDARFLQNGDKRSPICSRRPHRDGWSARTDLESRRCATVVHFWTGGVHFLITTVQKPHKKNLSVAAAPCLRYQKQPLPKGIPVS
jgi:hypothetical protein